MDVFRKKNKDTFIHGQIVNIYIVYEIILYNSNSNYPTLENTLNAEKIYSINFTASGNKFCLSLHYNGANSYLLVNGTEINKFKAKDSEIVATPLCLGNIAKEFSEDNTKKTGLNWYVYDFSVDYDAIAIDNVLDIHNHLMKKNDMV